MEEKPLILIADDERDIVAMLKSYFELKGYLVATAFDGAQVLERVARQRPDAILLDVNMPALDGMEACRAIRDSVSCPIIFLTARVEDMDKIDGFAAGGDDYVTKPFDLREVVARVHTILRRFEKVQESRRTEEASCCSIAVSEEEHTVLRDGRPVELTPKEFDLLLFFVKHPRQVFTRSALLDQIWGFDYLGDTRTVDIHIQRLRRKADLGEQLVTVFGVGYKYVP